MVTGTGKCAAFFRPGRRSGPIRSPSRLSRSRRSMIWSLPSKGLKRLTIPRSLTSNRITGISTAEQHFVGDLDHFPDFGFTPSFDGAVILSVDHIPYLFSGRFLRTFGQEGVGELVVGTGMQNRGLVPHESYPGDGEVDDPAFAEGFIDLFGRGRVV